MTRPYHKRQPGPTFETFEYVVRLPFHLLLATLWFAALNVSILSAHFIILPGINILFITFHPRGVYTRMVEQSICESKNLCSCVNWLTWNRPVIGDSGSL